jgi:hypothetical protein
MLLVKIFGVPGEEVPLEVSVKLESFYIHGCQLSAFDRFLKFWGQRFKQFSKV